MSNPVAVHGDSRPPKAPTTEAQLQTKSIVLTMLHWVSHTPQLTLLSRERRTIFYFIVLIWSR
jgi:hypothetical protein